MSKEVSNCPVAETCYECGDRQVCEPWFEYIGLYDLKT